MTITFCGHRDFTAAETRENKLVTLIEAIAAENKELICYNGGYGNFDNFACACTRTAQLKFSDIINCYVSPYMITDGHKAEFIMRSYDEIIYPPLENVPKKAAIIRRNQWMVENSRIIIACVKYGWGRRGAHARICQEKE